MVYRDDFDKLLMRIRKFYVTGHLDRTAFVGLLQTWGLDGLKLCEFIDIADDAKDRYEKKCKVVV